jgi:uncharacterized protein
LLTNEIYDMLACPKCQTGIEYNKDDNLIICLSCYLTYEIKHDIPVMLVDETKKYK